MRENARTRLAALREKKPPTKAAQLRSLWTEIKAALDNGHSLKAISECLAADGIAVSVRSLSVYVGRLRRGYVANPNLAPPAKTVLAGNVIPRPIAKSESASVEQSQKRSRDPLANVRDRQKKRPGFDYRPELADPKQLI